MFIGRSRELVALNRAFARGGFEFFVIYGRRRIGKTALIQEFIKDKPAIYYMGIEASTADNLALLSSAIAADYTASDVTYGSMHAALEDVFRKAESGRLVLVLDEYPYMAKADQSLASALQVLIDRYRDSSNLMLILCGSSVSYMEDDVLAYKSPLYGRKTGQIRLRPMDFLDSQRFHPPPVCRGPRSGIWFGRRHTALPEADR